MSHWNYSLGKGAYVNSSVSGCPADIHLELQPTYMQNVWSAINDHDARGAFYSGGKGVVREEAKGSCPSHNDNQEWGGTRGVAGL